MMASAKAAGRSRSPCDCGECEVSAGGRRRWCLRVYRGKHGSDGGCPWETFVIAVLCRGRKMRPGRGLGVGAPDSRGWSGPTAPGRPLRRPTRPTTHMSSAVLSAALTDRSQKADRSPWVLGVHLPCPASVSTSASCSNSAFNLLLPSLSIDSSRSSTL